MDSLTTNSAVPSDFEFCWEIYSENVRDKIAQFIRDGWIEEVEKRKFQKNWDANKSHIVKLNNQPVGWFAVDVSSTHVTVEHGYIAQKFQKKRIGTTILNFLGEMASKDKKALKVEVLNNSTANEFFAKNGFLEKNKLEITHVMELKK